MQKVDNSKGYFFSKNRSHFLIKYMSTRAVESQIKLNRALHRQTSCKDKNVVFNLRSYHKKLNPQILFTHFQYR